MNETTTETASGEITTGDPGSVRAAHTEGPWVHIPAHYPNQITIRRANHDFPTLIATVNRLAGNNEEANARLIAAAPEMLAALREAAEALKTTVDLFETETGFGGTAQAVRADEMKARAVIAKAEGRS